MAVNQATNSLHNMCSKTTLKSLERSSSSPEFVVNAEALPGNSLKRQLSFVDLQARGKQQSSRSADLLTLYHSLAFGCLNQNLRANSRASA